MKFEDFIRTPISPLGTRSLAERCSELLTWSLSLCNDNIAFNSLSRYSDPRTQAPSERKHKFLCSLCLFVSLQDWVWRDDHNGCVRNVSCPARPPLDCGLAHRSDKARENPISHLPNTPKRCCTQSTLIGFLDIQDIITCFCKTDCARVSPRNEDSKRLT